MFEVDDRVWSSIIGWGVVKKISCTNRVTVCFDKGVNLIFTEDGRLYDKGLRCLFFKEVVPQKEALEKIEENISRVIKSSFYFQKNTN